MALLFAHGSLMCEDSAKKTAPCANNFFAVKVRGFVRVLDFPSPYRMSEKTNSPCAVMNLEEKTGGVVFGACFEVSDDSLNELFVREQGYDLIKVRVECVKTGKEFEASTFVARRYEKKEQLEDSEKQEEYVTICKRGCERLGLCVEDQFLKNTYVGDKTLYELGFR